MNISKKLIINILKNLLFLCLGIAMLLWVYKDYDIKQLIKLLKDFNIWYIILSILFSVLSNISRAYRWNLLLEPIGEKVNVFNAFLSVQVMYLANLIVPRAGEVVRCTLLSRYEEKSFTKMVGTVIVERTADAVALFLIAIIAISTQIGTIKQFFIQNEEAAKNVEKILSLQNLIILCAVFVLGIVIVIIFRRNLKHTKLYSKIERILLTMLEGIKSIFKLKKPFLFILHTLFIYSMWLFMMYMFFIGFAPTHRFGIFTAITVFVMSGLAMIAPVQAGMGAYHVMVAGTLYVYGLTFEEGKDFAFIAHTSINLYLAAFGMITFIIMYFYNKKRSIDNTRSV